MKTMNYEFVKLALSQPDLKDVVEYMQEPIHILEEINSTLLNSSPMTKTSGVYMDISLSYDNLIHKYLPGIINDYCNLSLDYRNTEAIKKEKSDSGFIHYTAKDILLKSLAKITEETRILNNRLNESHSYELLVKNRLTSKLGIQNQALQLEGDTVQSHIVLDNKFNYEQFKKSQKDNFFKKNVVSENTQLEKKIEPVTKVEPNIPKPEESSSDYSGSFFSLIITLVCVALVGILPLVALNSSVLTNSSKIGKIGTTLSEQTYIANNINNLFANEPSYSQLSQDLLIKAEVIPNNLIKNNQIINAYSGNILINKNTINTKDDSFVISFDKIPKDACKQLMDEEIKINQEIVINDNPITSDNSNYGCLLNNNKIDIIYKI